MKIKKRRCPASMADLHRVVMSRSYSKINGDCIYFVVYPGGRGISNIIGMF